MDQLPVPSNNEDSSDAVNSSGSQDAQVLIVKQSIAWDVNLLILKEHIQDLGTNKLQSVLAAVFRISILILIMRKEDQISFNISKPRKGFMTTFRTLDLD